MFVHRPFPLRRAVARAVLAGALLGALDGWAGGPAGAQPAGAPPDLEVPAGQTEVLGGRHAYGEVVVRDGGEIAVAPYGGELGQGRLEITARRIVVEAGGRISGDAAGWRGISEGTGEGPGGGQGGITSLAARLADTRPAARRHPTGSGGGGAYGGRGGDGIYLTTRGEWAGGRPYGEACGADVQLGSAGGALPRSHHERTSIAGGSGGGVIVLRADEIVIDGTVSADGQDGPAAEFDAGGGGAGGGILIDAVRLEVGGAIRAAGGKPGVAYDIAGAGGGGRVKVRYEAGALEADRIDVRPGRGPCPGDTASPWGCEGSSCVVFEPPPEPLFVPLALSGGCVGSGRKAVVLVLDASTSMGQPSRSGRRAIEAAVEAADAFVSRLAPWERSGLVVFNRQAHVLQALTSDAAATRRALERVVLEGGSRLDLGLVAGAGVLGATLPGERAVLVLVTDGRPAAEVMGATVAAAERARAEGATVYALGIGTAVDAELLGRISGAPERVLLAPDAEDLDALYRAIGALEACPPPS